jgi:DNA invertase Pin-like site-specific DNA recombinase
MSQLGYARVSTTQQSLDQQEDALSHAGCERIFTDKMSGLAYDRPGLTELLAYARAGDTVTVVSLDRLGRSLVGIIKTIEELRAAGIVLVSLRESVDFGTPVGMMVAGIFSALAEYERVLIAERAASARAAAELRGHGRGGRPRAMTQPQIVQALALRLAGTSIPDIASTFGVSRATIYRAIA